MSNQDFTPQVAQSIYKRVRYEYIQQHNKNPQIQDRLEALVPYLFIVLEISLFMLSASHTLDVVSRFVPGVGSWFSLGLEVGLVGLAFVVHNAKHKGQQVEKLWLLTEFLLFVFLIGTNVGGSILMIVGNIAGANLKVTDYVTMSIAVVLSIIIPIATVTIGQALAKLFVDRMLDGDPVDQKWRLQAYDYLFPELFTAALSSGLTPGKAKQLAHQTALGFVGGNKQLVSLSGSIVSPDNTVNTDKKADRITDKYPDRVTLVTDKLLTASSYADKPKLSTKKAQAAQLFRDNPDWMDRKLRDLETETGIDRTTLGQAKQVILNET